MFGSFVRCLAAAVAAVGLAVAASAAAPSDPLFPPAPTLTSHRSTIVAGSGSYCWKLPTQPEGICADTIGPATSKRPLVVRPGETIRVDMKVAVNSFWAALVPPRGVGARRLGTRVLDTTQQHWRVRLPARLPRGWLLSIFATYSYGDGSFGARLAEPHR